MSNTVELKESKMKIVFRVVSEVRQLFQTENFLEAEQFCWNYEGSDHTLRIDQLWVKK